MSHRQLRRHTKLRGGPVRTAFEALANIINSPDPSRILKVYFAAKDDIRVLTGARTSGTFEKFIGRLVKVRLRLHCRRSGRSEAERPVSLTFET